MNILLWINNNNIHNIYELKLKRMYFLKGIIVEEKGMSHIIQMTSIDQNPLFPQTKKDEVFLFNKTI